MIDIDEKKELIKFVSLLFLVLELICNKLYLIHKLVDLGLSLVQKIGLFINLIRLIMAKVTSGILGGFSGKIGNIIGSSWKGISVMKIKPQSVANPQTAGQVTQRASFSTVIALAQAILSTMIKPLWDRFAVKQSGYNAFVSANIANCNDSGLVNPALFVLSSGKMASTPILTPAVDAGGSTCALTWVDDSGEGYKLAGDVAFVAIYNTVNKQLGYVETTETRDSASISGSFGIDVSAGNACYVYLAFRRADGTIVSETAYATVTAGA